MTKNKNANKDGKNNKPDNKGNKSAEVKKEAEKIQKAKDKAVKKETEKVIVPETVETVEEVAPVNTAVAKKLSTIGDLMVSSAVSGSDANDFSFNSLSNLAYVMQQRYTNPGLKAEFPELFNAMNRNIDVVVFLALVKVQGEISRMDSAGILKIQHSADQIIQLQDIANTLGVTLSETKALPGGVQETTLANIPEELKDAEPQSVMVKLPAPSEVKAETDLPECFEHIIKTEPNFAVAIMVLVDYIREFFNAKAETVEAKEAVAEKTVYDWLTQIFSMIKVPALLTGLGRSLQVYTSQTGSVIPAYSIMYKHMKDRWTDEEIALTTKFLLQENFKYRLASDDSKGITFADDKTMQVITSHENIEHIYKILAKDSPETAMIFGMTRGNMFEKKENVSSERLFSTMARIINLFRSPEDRLQALESPIFDESLIPVKDKKEKETPKEDTNQEHEVKSEEPKKEEKPASTKENKKANKADKKK